MTRGQVRGAATAALASAALLTSGCGSAASRASTIRASHSGPSTTQAALGNYVTSVSMLEKPIEKAASLFFHSPHTPEAQLRRANALRDAYAKSARQLSTITPPAVGVAAQRNLVHVWSGVAGQLADLTAWRPFSYSHAYSVAAAAEQPTSAAYAAILSLP